MVVRRITRPAFTWIPFKTGLNCGGARLDWSLSSFTTESYSE
uniref:Uncharacterized protein n=1 Tax=Anguilla anguilla TaxID=7936 RepID=A0A0E9UN15_ANGAN